MMPHVESYVDSEGVLCQRIVNLEVDDLRDRISKATTIAQIKAPLLEVLDLLEKGETNA